MNELIALFVVLILVVLYLAMTTKDEESFIVYSYPKYCSACGQLDRYRCNNCVNCGYCYTPNGNGECVPGDGNGPYFREDCVAYEHSGNISGTGRPGYRVRRVYPNQYYWDRYRNTNVNLGRDWRHRNTDRNKGVKIQNTGVKKNYNKNKK